MFGVTALLFALKKWRSHISSLLQIDMDMRVHSHRLSSPLGTPEAMRCAASLLQGQFS